MRGCERTPRRIKIEHTACVPLCPWVRVPGTLSRNAHLVGSPFLTLNFRLPSRYPEHSLPSFPSSHCSPSISSPCFLISCSLAHNLKDLQLEYTMYLGGPWGEEEKKERLATDVSSGANLWGKKNDFGLTKNITWPHFSMRATLLYPGHCAGAQVSMPSPLLRISTFTLPWGTNDI